MTFDLEREKEKHRSLQRRMSQIMAAVTGRETVVLLYRGDDGGWSITASAPPEQQEGLKPVLDFITGVLNGIPVEELTERRELLEYRGEATV